MKYYDLRGCDTLPHVGYTHFHINIDREPANVRIAREILKLAVESNTPLFVYFDELGSLGTNVRDLRDVVQQTRHLMLQYGGDMPRVYFYLSGKSVPLTAIGGPDAGVGTKWIILDLLQELMSLDMFQSPTSRF